VTCWSNGRAARLEFVVAGLVTFVCILREQQRLLPFSQIVLLNDLSSDTVMTT
jgi:hypothetical protein